MKIRVAGMLALVVSMVAVVFGSSAFAVEPTWLSEDSFGTTALQASTLQAPLDTEKVAENLAEFEADHEDSISTPRAILERENSTDLFTDLGAGSAAALFLERFRVNLQALTTLPSDPVLDADEIVKINDDSSISIDPQGPRESSLIVSDAPLRNESNEILNNSLSAEGSAFVPEAALTETTIPGSSAGQVEFPEAGLSMGLGVQPGGGSSGEILSSAPGENDVVFYPNTGKDTDTAVAATLGGVETFSVLRSEESPEALAFDYEMPAGATLSATDDGGAAITDGEADPLAQIYPPYAVDSQGSFVPVTLSVEGDSVVLNVEHVNADLAYPILVDPVVHVRDWWTNGASANYLGWTFNQAGSTNYVGSNTCPSAVLPGDPCGGTGAGLYASAQPGVAYPSGSMGYWTFTAPGGPSTSIVGADIGSWRFRTGPATGGNPYAFFALGNTGTNMVANTAGGGSNYSLTGSANNTKLFNVGLATNANVTLPSGSSNWRYNRLSGFAVELTDNEAPTINMTGLPTGWLKDNTAFSVTANAADPGLGLGWIQTGLWGDPMVNQWAGWCTGTYGAECPKTASPTLNFNTSTLTSGTNVMLAKALDVLAGSGHETGTTFNVYVDKTNPSITGISPLVEGGTTLAPGQLDLSFSTSDTYSGVKRLEFRLDGTLIEAQDAVCETLGNCDIANAMELDLSGKSAGSHSWSLKAIDMAGNEVTKSGTMTLDPAPPTLAVTGTLPASEATELSVASVSAMMSATDNQSGDTGIKRFSVQVDEATPVVDTKTCSPNCPGAATGSYTYTKIDWGPGPHVVEIDAVDAAGNTTTRSYNIDVPGVPAIDPVCPTVVQTVDTPANIATTSAAAAILGWQVPAATAASTQTTMPGTGDPIEPSLEPATPGTPVDLTLDITGSKALGYLGVAAESGFTVGGSHCLVPMASTSATTDAAIVNDDSAIYANTAPSTDTLVRPTPLGTEVVESIRAASAPTSFEWQLELANNEALVDLPGGGVAVVETVDQIDPLDSVGTAQSLTMGNLADSDAQIDLSSYGSNVALNETERVVKMVIPPPAASDLNGDPVTATLTTSGTNRVSLNVDHASGSAYPIVAAYSATSTSSTKALDLRGSPNCHIGDFCLYKKKNQRGEVSWYNRPVGKSFSLASWIGRGNSSMNEVGACVGSWPQSYWQQSTQRLFGMGTKKLHHNNSGYNTYGSRQPQVLKIFRNNTCAGPAY